MRSYFPNSPLTPRLHSHQTILDWWQGRARLPDDVKSRGPAIVKATLDIYSTLRRELLPTPSKSHYLYNLRDLCKLFQGVQMVGAPVDAPSKLIRLWAHETMRWAAWQLVWWGVWGLVYVVAGQ